MLNQKNTKNIVEKYSKAELPIFISVASFSQMLGEIYLLNSETFKFNILQNLITMYENHLESNDKIFAIR